MLWPERMAAMAASSTAAGTGVSQTPWARLMPPMRSHSVVMARISDCMTPGASSLKARRDAVCGGGATVWDMGVFDLFWDFTWGWVRRFVAYAPSRTGWDTVAAGCASVESMGYARTFHRFEHRR